MKKIIQILFILVVVNSCKLLTSSGVPSNYKSILAGAGTVTTQNNFQIIGNLPDADSTSNFLNIKLFLSANKDLSSTDLSQSVVSLTSSIGLPVTGTATVSKRFLTFKPASNLDAGVKYTLKLSKTLKSSTGETLIDDYQFSFTTGSANITTPPVPSTATINTSSSLPYGATVQTNFSNPIDPNSATTNISVTNTSTGAVVAGNYNSSGSVVYFTPTTALTSGTNYTMTITSGLQDIAGNATTTSYTTNFTYGTSGTVAITVGGSGSGSTAVTTVLPIKTGQTTSYATGDDGNLQIGTARSYTDNSDGTIKDNATGLTWQKCSQGLSGTTCATGSATTSDWTTANSYCSGLSLASKTWRLPTYRELGDLVDYSRSSSPVLNITFFPNTFNNYYWSSTAYALNTINAWVVDFNDMATTPFAKTNTYYVRCVSGQIQALTTFTENGDGTVNDNSTGLIWQKCSQGLSGTSCGSGSATTATWASAVSYCNSLSLASKTWRLPNLNELKTIVDYSKSSGAPVIDSTIFPATIASLYWISTTYTPSPTSALWLNFNTGANSYNSKTGFSYNVRCVSGP